MEILHQILLGRSRMSTASQEEPSEHLPDVELAYRPEMNERTSPEYRIQPKSTSEKNLSHSVDGAARKRSLVPSHNSTALPVEPQEKPDDALEANKGNSASENNEKSFDPLNAPRFGDLNDYWRYFDQSAKEESDGMIKGLKENLDNLLIFVSTHLFSQILVKLIHHPSGRFVFCHQFWLPMPSPSPC